MASSDQKASAGVYVTPDVGLEVTDGTYSRVQIGKITTTPSYGIRVLSSDGSTVIIDGTSDMFKIAASGTLSGTNPANQGGTTFGTVALSSLGTMSVVLMFVGVLYNSATGIRYFAQLTDTAQTDWAAASSGGAVTTALRYPTDRVGLRAFIDGSNFMNIEMVGYNDTASGIAAQCKYYVLQEAAL